MSIDSNSTSKVKEFMKEGKKFKLEIQDCQEALKDLAKTISTDLSIKPALLMKALNVAFANKAGDVREDFSTVEDILAIAGEI